MWQSQEEEESFVGSVRREELYEKKKDCMMLIFSHFGLWVGAEIWLLHVSNARRTTLSLLIAVILLKRIDFDHGD